jgi:hypothetical protein
MAEKISIKIPRYNRSIEIHRDWIIYFPFIGWFYAFTLRDSDEFAMHHATQAFTIAMVFTAIPVMITFFTPAIPITLRWARLAAALLVYASHFLYFFACIVGARQISGKSTEKIPYISALVQKIGI